MTVKWKRKAFYVIAEALCIIVFLIAAGIFLYPFWNDWRDTMEINEQIKKFNKIRVVVSDAKVPYEDLLHDLKLYNDDLFAHGQGKMINPLDYETFPINVRSYGLPDDMIGYVSIPEIDLEFPIYLGANYENMKNGAAVLGHSSAPIGELNTHSVLAGHNYWNGSKKFAGIAKLNIGDEVIITNLWDTLRYKVTSTRVLTPSEFNAFLIQQNKDMVSIFTCFYTSRGKDRFAVFCERAE